LSGDRFLSYINKEGKVMKTFEEIKHTISDAAMGESGDILMTSYSEDFVSHIHYSTVMKLSTQDDSLSIFARFRERQAQSICIDSNNNAIVSLHDNLRSSPLIKRLDSSGRITQEFKIKTVGNTTSMTCLSSGELVLVIEGTIEIYNNKGTLTKCLKGEQWSLQNFNFNPRSITHDTNNNLYITDDSNNRIYFINKDGSGATFLNGKRLGIETVPRSIAMDNTDRLWLGCRDSDLYILE